MDALRWWKFEPYRVNGQAETVEQRSRLSSKSNGFRNLAFGFWLRAFSTWLPGRLFPNIGLCICGRRDWRRCVPKAGSRTSVFLPAQSVQHRCSADSKAEHCSQRRDQQQIGAEMQNVGEDGGDRKEKSKTLSQSERELVWANLCADELKQQSGQTDGCDHNQGKRAEERGAAGVNHHQSEREKQQTGGNDAPAARPG